MNSQSLLGEHEVATGAVFHGALADTWNGNYRQGGFRRRLEFVRGLLASAVKPGSRWLDAGCGAGTLSVELARLGATGEGVDGSDAMIASALRESAARAPGFSFRRIGTLACLDLPDAAFDGALCSSVIEYVEEPGKALSELYRVLKPGGILILSVPNRLSPIRAGQRSARKAARIFGRDPFPYLGVSINDYSRRTLKTLIAEPGFRDPSIAGFDPLIPRTAWPIWPPALFFLMARKPTA